MTLVEPLRLPNRRVRITKSRHRLAVNRLKFWIRSLTKTRGLFTGLAMEADIRTRGDSP